MAEWWRMLIGIDTATTTTPTPNSPQPLVYASQTTRTCLFLFSLHSPATVDKQKTAKQNKSMRTHRRQRSLKMKWKPGGWKEQLLILADAQGWLDRASAPSVTSDLLALTVMISVRGTGFRAADTCVWLLIKDTEAGLLCGSTTTETCVLSLWLQRVKNQ